MEKIFIPVVLSTVITLIVFLVNLLYQRHRNKELDYNARLSFLTDTRYKLYTQLILFPRFQHIEAYFEGLERQLIFLESDLTYKQINELQDVIDNLYREMNANFTVHLSLMEYELADQIDKELDQLTDHLTDTIQNKALKLNHPPTKEKYINRAILDAQSKIYQHVPDVTASLRELENISKKR